MNNTTPDTIPSYKIRYTVQLKISVVIITRVLRDIRSLYMHLHVSVWVWSEMSHIAS